MRHILFALFLTGCATDPMASTAVDAPQPAPTAPSTCFFSYAGSCGVCPPTQRMEAGQCLTVWREGFKMQWRPCEAECAAPAPVYAIRETLFLAATSTETAGSSCTSEGVSGVCTASGWTQCTDGKLASFKQCPGTSTCMMQPAYLDGTIMAACVKL